MIQASAVLDEAAALLSDPDKQFFTNDKLLVYLKRALGEFQLDLINNGSPFLKERAELTLAGNDTDLTVTGIVEPITVSLKESEGDYLELIRVASYLDLNEEEDDEIVEWAWREGVIVVKNHPNEITLVVDYYKELFDFATLDADTTLQYVNIQMFAATRTAAIAAAYLGREDKMADRLTFESEIYKAKLINREVRSRQSTPARRRGLFRRRVFTVDV